VLTITPYRDIVVWGDLLLWPIHEDCRTCLERYPRPEDKPGGCVNCEIYKAVKTDAEIPTNN
jgi:hypothetical protein